MKVFVTLGAHEIEAYRQALRDAKSAQSLDIEILDEAHAKDAEMLVFSPDSPIRDFNQFPNLRYVQSIWAGVDSIVGNPTLNVPLARMVDGGLAEGMREYVLGHILADHVEIERYQRATSWDAKWLPLARSKTIGIVGIGVLGQSVADAARTLGFNVVAWSNSPKDLPYPSFTGRDGLFELLRISDYVVTLLPNTPETADIIDADFLKAMKSDAMLINPGRGALLDETALIDALNACEIRRAVLDVFKKEPLPANHPFWQNDKILITPHIAAKSRLETTLDVILENISRAQNGEPLLYEVDRSAGY